MSIIEETGCADPYYVAYYIMLHALNDSNIKDGLVKSLYLTKLVLKADDIVLFKKNSEGIYEHVLNQPYMIDDSNFLSRVLNIYSEDIEKKQVFHLGFQANAYQENGTTFLSIPCQNSQYVFAVTNKKLTQDDSFTDLLIQTYGVILKKLEAYDQIKRESVKDPLTGLDNRKPYTEKMTEIDQNDDVYYYMLFDLFRLKFVNDQFSHSLGDQYIVKAADILKRYFPKYHIMKSKNGKIVKSLTGGCVYRIGGDEFVLIAKKDAYDDILTRASHAIDEVSRIKLDENQDILVGLNFGFSYRDQHQTSTKLYLDSDQYLSLDKSKMYRDYHIDRRK